ncbi:FAH family protein [Burkholderia pyrrocinia]|uniref:FAH family protein n=1 Tax=Burkholderia pyrrocinia TaxID=60550 RepID=UPI001FB38F6A|nr:FAH family protein [Burkholderia pyrrocinia]UOB57828.1 FAH family protein [Burkholderia pyrrocinia]
MTIKFMEGVLRGERFVGFVESGVTLPNEIYRISLAKLCEATGGTTDGAVAKEYLLKSVSSVKFSDQDMIDFSPLPPLFPDAAGDAVASGFMQTHNVKIESARDDHGEIVLPNWFVKGLGSSVKLSGQPLRAPKQALALCEEAEVVLVYRSNADGRPEYCGYTFGNDLTDIGRFKRNPGHLAYAKLCDAAVSSWFHIAPPPQSVQGEVSIERDGTVAWNGNFKTGLNALGYRLADMVDHLFSYSTLSHPGRIHYVFIGADRSSFHAGFSIKEGDRIVLNFASHDVVISNQIQFA